MIEVLKDQAQSIIIGPEGLGIRHCSGRALFVREAFVLKFRTKLP